MAWTQYNMKYGTQSEKRMYRRGFAHAQAINYCVQDSIGSIDHVIKQKLEEKKMASLSEYWQKTEHGYVYAVRNELTGMWHYANAPEPNGNKEQTMKFYACSAIEVDEKGNLVKVHVENKVLQLTSVAACLVALTRLIPTDLANKVVYTANELCHQLTA